MASGSPGGGCAIAVMAKAPVPGRVKTRLVPPLTPEQAAMLSAAFLADITHNIWEAAAAAPIIPYVAYAPAGAEHLFDGVLAPGTRLILADGKRDFPCGIEGFGRCLAQAIVELLERGHDSACVLNSDSPTLPTDYLVQAAQALSRKGDRIVLGPADDGGYYLLGMAARHINLFCDIAWSTARVADETRARAQEHGLEIVELPAWYDVDDGEAMRRLLRFYTAGPVSSSGRDNAYRAPATAACLTRLKLDLDTLAGLKVA
jgi:uncharacterized protein